MTVTEGTMTTRMTDFVRTGRKCETCSRDQWHPIKSALRCRCGRWGWIERTTDAQGGTHVPSRQGETLPAGWRGWLRETK